jgi:uncharacterized protein
MTAQYIINSLEFARKSREIHDIIPADKLHRVQELVEPQSGSLKWQLIGEVGADGKAQLNLSISLDLMLKCQRCMEPMEFAFNTQAKFVIVGSESELPNDEADLQEDFLIASESFDVMGLIEDEVILSLPYAVMHEAGQCPSQTLDNLQKASNPFAVLKDFKSSKN